MTKKTYIHYNVLNCYAYDISFWILFLSPCSLSNIRLFRANQYRRACKLYFLLVYFSSVLFCGWSAWRYADVGSWWHCGLLHCCRPPTGNAQLYSVQCSAVMCTVQCSHVHSTVQLCSLQCSIVQCCNLPCSTVQRVYFGTALCGARSSSARPSLTATNTRLHFSYAYSEFFHWLFLYFFQV